MSDAPVPIQQPVRRPHWGYQASLFQPRQPAFWLFTVLMLLTGWITFAEQKAFSELAPSGWALSWILLLVYAVPMFILIYALDLYEREPWSLVLGAFLWGAVGAVALSGIANVGWAVVVYEVGGLEFAQEWMPAIVAPPVEETLKAVGVIFIYLIARREVDDIMDGFVYGALVGLGFTVVEDVFYFIANFGGTTEGVLTGFYLRVVSSGIYGHVLYTGLAGMGIAYFTSRRGERGLGARLGVAVLLFLIAMGGHFLWNSPLLSFFPEQPWEGSDWLQIPIATTVKGLPLLLFVVVMVRLAHHREGLWLHGALASEVDRGGITRDELETLRSTRERRRARADLSRRAGPIAGKLLKKLQREQVNLAMIRTRIGEHDHPDLDRQRGYCAALRGQLERMLGVPAGAAVPLTAVAGSPAPPPESPEPEASSPRPDVPPPPAPPDSPPPAPPD